MDETMTIYVPGPMEPDLFGGETPRMIPVAVEAWDAGFDWWTGDEDEPEESDSFDVTVAATREGEAEALLVMKAEAKAPKGATLEMQWMEAFGMPSADMAEEYRQYRWLMHQNEQDQAELKEAA